jgi:medium-chain acyl-[acyl-carrier-protein] hydrolase
MTKSVLRPRAQPDPKVRLLCFAHAGGSASVYVPWQKPLGPEIEVCAVQLPGRGARLSEPPFAGARELLDAVVPDLLPELDRPYAMFGHSMGTILMFEVARELRRRGAPQPMRLFVASFPPPEEAARLRAIDGYPIHDVPEQVLLAHLSRLGAKHVDVLMADDELKSLLLPIVRADYALLSTYTYAAEAPLDAPITAFAGERDPFAPPAVTSKWAAETTHPLDFHVRPGGHFFLEDDRPFVLDLIRRSCIPGRP